MLFVGHSLGGIIAVSQLAHEIYINVFTDVRLPDKFQREIDDLKREICEQLVNSESHRSLYETRALTQTVSDCRTSLKELEQLLKDRKIDDGTTLGRISQLKMRLYVSRTNIERLKTYSALCVSQRQALSLSQKRLLVPDDASAILRTLVEEPIDVPISDTAGSMDDRRFIYRSDKNLGAMRGPHKTWLEGRDNDTSLLWVPESPGSGKSTTFPAFIDYGLCTTFMTTTMYCYPGLGDQELCDNSMHSLPTDDRSHDLFYLHGLDKGAVIASSSLSETRSSLNDLYVSCTVCHGTKYNSPFSTHKGFSYRSWANLGSTTTISSATIRSSSIWSDDTPRPWFLRRWLLQELVHAMSSVSLRTSKILTLVSPIFFTSPASAEASHCGSQNDTVRLKTEPRDYNSWSQALNNVQRDLLYLWTHPNSPHSMSNDDHHPNAEVQPSTILLACFLCTSCVALVAQVGRNDPYQTHIVALCAMKSSIGGALLTDDVQAFVFLYLFWGCLGGLVISLFLHRVGAVTALEQLAGLPGKTRVDDDELIRGLGDQKY